MQNYFLSRIKGGKIPGPLRQNFINLLRDKTVFFQLRQFCLFSNTIP